MGGGQKARSLPPEYLKSRILGPIYLLKSLENKPKRYCKVGSQRKRSPLARGSRTNSDWKVQWEKNRAVIG